MSDYYILDDHTPVPVDHIRWAEWVHRNRETRRVARTALQSGVVISTVFLGLDHGYGDGPPILFETMIFGGPHNEDQERCSTWEEAEAMHARMVERATAEMKERGDE